MIWIIYAILLILLFILSFQDLKKKEVSYLLIGVVILLAIASAFIRIFIIKESMQEILLRLLPGLALIGIALIAENAVGLADGLVLLACGSILSSKETLLALVIMFALMMLISIGLLISRKADRKSKMAMIPFVTVGTLASIILERFI